MEENEQSTVVQSQKKGFGIAGLVLGILSILCCMCMGAGLIFCIIGGIFSIISVSKGKWNRKNARDYWPCGEYFRASSERIYDHFFCDDD